MDQVTISVDLANSIWGYLATKPFAEVANLATAFQQAVGQQVAAIEAAKAAAATPVEATETAN
jgi:hypothetical protein